MFSFFSKKEVPLNHHGRFYDNKVLKETISYIDALKEKRHELAKDIDTNETPSFELIKKHSTLNAFLKIIDRVIENYNTEPEQSVLEVSSHCLLALAELMNSHLQDLNYFRSSSKKIAGKAGTISSYVLTYGAAGLLTTSTFGAGAIAFFSGGYFNNKSKGLISYDAEKTATVEKLILLMDNLVKIVKFYQTLPDVSFKDKKLAAETLKALTPNKGQTTETGNRMPEIEEAIQAITHDQVAFLDFFEGKFPRDKKGSIYCPISFTIMTDPVVLGRTGHTFNRDAIEHSLINNPGKDPVGNTPIEDSSLETNFNLKDMILTFIEEIKDDFLAQAQERDEQALYSEDEESLIMS